MKIISNEDYISLDGKDIYLTKGTNGECRLTEEKPQLFKCKETITNTDETKRITFIGTKDFGVHAIIYLFWDRVGAIHSITVDRFSGATIEHRITPVKNDSLESDIVYNKFDLDKDKELTLYDLMQLTPRVEKVDKQELQSGKLDKNSYLEYLDRELINEDLYDDDDDEEDLEEVREHNKPILAEKERILNGDEESLKYKRFSDIWNKPNNWDELLFDVVRFNLAGIISEETKQHLADESRLIKIGSKFYLYNRCTGVECINITETFNLTYGGIYVDRISNKEFIDILLKSKDEVQCKPDNSLGFYCLSQEIPEDNKRLNLYLDCRDGACVLVGAINELRNELLEIKIADYGSTNIVKLQVTHNYIILLNDRNKICKAYKRLLGLPYREASYNLAEVVHEHLTVKDCILDISNIPNGFTKISSVNASYNDFRTSYTFGIDKSSNDTFLAVVDKEGLTYRDSATAPYNSKMKNIYVSIASKFGKNLNVSKVEVRESFHIIRTENGFITRKLNI